MSKKDAMERMVREGQELIDQAAKAAWWEKEVVCVLCRDNVARKNTVLLEDGPIQGPACKKHPGVGR